MAQVASWLFETIGGKPVALLRERLDDTGARSRQLRNRDTGWRAKYGVDHYGIGGDSMWDPCAPERAAEVIWQWETDRDAETGTGWRWDRAARVAAILFSEDGSRTE